MLTPLDIHNHEFKKGLRGYDVDEVDGFLDEIIRDFEVLYKENMELKETIQKKQTCIKQYQDLEQTLQETLILAQKTGEEIRQNSQKEAELIIWEAQKKAEKIHDEAQAKIIATTQRLEEMRSLETQFYVKMKSFLRTQLESIESYREMENLAENTERVVSEDEQEESNGDSWWNKVRRKGTTPGQL